MAIPVERTFDLYPIQLIVNETQEAFVVHEGVYDGPFGAGRHTLSTENLPLLRSFMKIPFGDKTPFTAEVWFVNRTFDLNITWGTPDPIQLVDPKYKIMLPVRAYGKYGIRIADPKKFLLKLVGTLDIFSSSTINAYFRGIFTTRIKTEIANLIVKDGLSVLEIAPHLTNLSTSLQQILSGEMAEYGVSLVLFSIQSINTPEDDPAVRSLKQALAKRAEMGIVGFNYQQQRSFDVLETAAGNEGTEGTLAGAGIGLGAGLGLSSQFANAMKNIAPAMNVGNSSGAQPAAETPSSMPSAAPSGETRLKLLKELSALRKDGTLSEEEFAAEKKRILEM
jgi:membrane protease subunit (stomatin/prohibitin family)